MNYLHDSPSFRPHPRFGVIFPFRIDPCLNLPSFVFQRGLWSDRHGIIERYPTVARPGQTPVTAAEIQRFVALQKALAA